MKHALWFAVSVLFMTSAAAFAGIVQEQSIWDEREISVCWENPEAVNPDELNWVSSAVERSWSLNSQVSFSGWEKCASSSKGIRIYIGDVNPTVFAIGNNLDGLVGGMILNFSFENWAQNCQSRRQFCIETVAIHEFGHALGFVHEEGREDTPGEVCMRSPNGEEGDLVIGDWDLYSVLNGCSPDWNSAGLLSDTDIQMVQQFYGVPTESDVDHIEEEVAVCDASTSVSNQSKALLAIDDSFGTGWSAKGDGQWLELNLCEKANVSRVEIAWAKGDIRTEEFTMQVGEGSEFTTIYGNSSNGKTKALQGFDTPDVETDTLRLVTYGSSTTAWAKISEVRVYSELRPGEPDITDLRQPAVFRVSNNDDTSLALTWVDTSTGEDGFLIQVAVNYGSYETFAVTPPNAQSYIHKGLIPGSVYQYKIYSARAQDRSLQATGQGETPADSEGEAENQYSIEITPYFVSAEDEHESNIAENAFDSSSTSYWAASGKNEELIIDLGTDFNVTSFQIAWHKGDQRYSRFSVSSSDNGVSWDEQFNGQSSGTTLSLQDVEISDFSARYIKIIGKGNEKSDWNSITDIKIFGY